MGYIVGAFFVGGVIVLGRLLRRRKREGAWYKDYRDKDSVTWVPPSSRRGPFR